MSNVGLEGFGVKTTSAINAPTGAMNHMSGRSIFGSLEEDCAQLVCAAAKKEVCEYDSKSSTCTLCIDLSFNCLLPCLKTGSTRCPDGYVVVVLEGVTDLKCALRGSETQRRAKLTIH